LHETKPATKNGMSAFGPKRTSLAASHMPAFGGKADIDAGMVRDLILPEAFEVIRRQSRVTDGRVDRLVPKIVLDCPGVLAIVCQLVATGMPQHVAVHEEREAGGLTCPRNHALITGHAQRRQALGDKHVGAGWSFTLEPAQRPQLAPSNRVHTGSSALGASHVKLAGGRF